MSEKLGRLPTMLIDEINPQQIEDEKLRALVSGLLNIIEDLRAEVKQVREENQRLRDEINRLKGEQGKPDIKPPPAEKRNYSSEGERRGKRRQRKGRKHDQIDIDHEIVLSVNREVLPLDAQFKGYEPHIVQDIVVRTDNTRFQREKFYSASQRKTYLAALPPGYEGEFGPTIRAQVLMLYYAGNMTQPRVHDWLKQVGVRISSGQIGRWLIHDQDAFHNEEAAAYHASLAECPWQHIDDTGTRVDGVNHFCHIVTSPLAMHYHTQPSKSRLSVLEVLQNHTSGRFLLNEQALTLMEYWHIPERYLWQLEAHFPREEHDQAFTKTWMMTHLATLSETHRRRILDALAIAAYQAQTDIPIVRLLISDDAPQFQAITQARALCWIHEGRHYKKLTPTLPHHHRLQQHFLRAFWRYYDRLKRYRQQPTPHMAHRLSHQFDRLFALRTGYAALDRLIARTQAHKQDLLQVLAHPEIELHNNPAELGARRRVRKRHISFGPRSDAGRRAWDTFMSLAGTTHLLGISFFHYLKDRLMRRGDIPSLPDLIRQRATDLNLAYSWNTP